MSWFGFYHTLHYIEAAGSAFGPIWIRTASNSFIVWQSLSLWQVLTIKHLIEIHLFSTMLSALPTRQWSGKTKFESGLLTKLTHILASSTTLINFDTIFRKSFHSILRLRPKMSKEDWLALNYLLHNGFLATQDLSDESFCFYFRGMFTSNLIFCSGV